MENNKIIRRYGILKEDVYDRFSQDMCELFSDFESVTCTSTEGTENVSPYTVISFDTQNRLYLRIDSDVSNGVSLSLHLGNGNTLGRDYINIDNTGITNSTKASYSFARSPYGAVFSVVNFSESNENTVSDSQLRVFFSTFTDEEGNEHYGVVYCDKSGTESTSNLTITLATTAHSFLERINGSSLFLGALANHNVLCNAFSYTMPYIATRLYKELQTEGSVFGKAKIGGKTLIMGSNFALECIGEEDS